MSLHGAEQDSDLAAMSCSDNVGCNKGLGAAGVDRIVDHKVVDNAEHIALHSAADIGEDMIADFVVSIVGYIVGLIDGNCMRVVGDMLGYECTLVVLADIAVDVDIEQQGTDTADRVAPSPVNPLAGPSLGCWPPVTISSDRVCRFRSYRHALCDISRRHFILKEIKKLS